MIQDELLRIERELGDGPGDDRARSRRADVPLALAPRRQHVRGRHVDVYVRREGAWKVVLHQQTPEP